MTNLKDLNNLTYKQILESNIRFYLNEYGRKKFHKVLQKVQTSKKLGNILKLSIQMMKAPNENDYLYNLMETPIFMFAKPDTIAMAGLLLLERWNQECNTELDLANEIELKEIAFRILLKCEKLKFKR